MSDLSEAALAEMAAETTRRTWPTTREELLALDRRSLGRIATAVDLEGRSKLTKRDLARVLANPSRAIDADQLREAVEAAFAEHTRRRQAADSPRWWRRAWVLTCSAGHRLDEATAALGRLKVVLVLLFVALSVCGWQFHDDSLVGSLFQRFGGSPLVETDHTIHFSGRLTHGLGDRGLPGVSVRLAHSPHIAAVTDDKGRFQLEIPDGRPGNFRTLELLTPEDLLFVSAGDGTFALPNAAAAKSQGRQFPVYHLGEEAILAEQLAAIAAAVRRTADRRFAEAPLPTRLASSRSGGAKLELALASGPDLESLRQEEYAAIAARLGIEPSVLMQRLDEWAAETSPDDSLAVQATKAALRKDYAAYDRLMTARRTGSARQLYEIDREHGDSLYGRQQDAEALEHYTAALRVSQQYLDEPAGEIAELRLRIGNCHLSSDTPQRVAAIANYTAVIDMPDASVNERAWALYNRGVTYGRLAPPQTDREIADYTAVINMPDAPAEQRATALVNRGVAYGQMDPPQVDKKIADYTAVIDMPDAPAEQRADALINRGITFGQLDPPLHDKAIADYTAVIDMPNAPAEDRAWALVNRALAHGLMDPPQVDKAIADYTAVLNIPGALTSTKSLASEKRAELLATQSAQVASRPPKVGTLDKVITK